MHKLWKRVRSYRYEAQVCAECVSDYMYRIYAAVQRIAVEQLLKVIDCLRRVAEENFSDLLRQYVAKLCEQLIARSSRLKVLASNSYVRQGRVGCVGAGVWGALNVDGINSL